jgi:hypothetical protein
MATEYNKIYLDEVSQPLAEVEHMLSEVNKMLNKSGVDSEALLEPPLPLNLSCVLPSNILIIPTTMSMSVIFNEDCEIIFPGPIWPLYKSIAVTY